MRSITICLLAVAVLVECVLATAVTPLTATLDPLVAAKMDPRLALICCDPARAAKSFNPTITSQDLADPDLLVPVIVKTTASRTRLEHVGAIIGSQHGDIVTARVPLEKLEELALLQDVEAIEASYRLYNLLDVSLPECGGTAVHNGSPPYYGSGVTVGLLDTGIDPYHPDFLNPSGQTRVQYIWDQWSQTGPAPSGYSYGREWTKAQIDVGQCTMTDEGYHGSHCAGIAAGDGSASAAGYIGMAPLADIIMVSNLAEDIFTYGYAPPWYQNPSTMGSLDGLSYIRAKSNQLGNPLVVSWSQGVTMGPHDGSTLFEQGVDNFASQYDVPIVIAAGNDQQSGWHAEGTTSSANPLTATFTTGISGQSQPTGLVKFEVWYELGDLMNVQLMDPWGGVTTIWGPDETTWPGWIVSTGDTVWCYSISNHPVSHKGYFYLELQNWNIGVNQGTWTIQVSAANGLPQGGHLDMWFERNQPSVWWLDHMSFDAIVGMPGSAREVITVGSYNTKLQWIDVDGTQQSINELVGEISDFSSNGPTADGRQKPDLSAPGQIIASVLSSGGESYWYQYGRTNIAPDGVHLLIQGTSMATPHVAGTVALMLEKNPNLTRSEIKQILTTTARHDQYTGQGWSPDFGWGKLDAFAAVAAAGGGGGETVELIYDDGTPTSGYYWSCDGCASGVEVSPPSFPATIVKLKYYIMNLAAGGTGNGTFQAFAIDKNAMDLTTSVTVTPTATGWFEVDVSSQSIDVTDDFIVVMMYDGYNTPSYGYDPVDNGRAWDYDGTGWAPWNETYFMRAIVSTGLATEDEIELAGLSASSVEGAVRLTWQPTWEWDVAGYHIHRADEPATGAMQQINESMILGNAFSDDTIQPGETYFYWLEAVSASGTGTLFGPVEATTLGGPTTLWLLQPKPTPTRDVATLRFNIPEAGIVSATLYDLAGRRTQSIIEPQTMDAGWQSMTWRLPGSSLPSGTYVCRLKFESDEVSLESSRPLIVAR
jgi:minor extracellular serine protease Vpr